MDYNENSKQYVKTMGLLYENVEKMKKANIFQYKKLLQQNVKYHKELIELTEEMRNAVLVNASLLVNGGIKDGGEN